MKKTFIPTLLFSILGAVLYAEVLPAHRVRVSSYAGESLLPRYAVDGSGVLNDLHENYPPFTMWAAQSGQPVSEAWFECDLGQICVLSLMRLYNYNDKWSQLDYTDHGVQHFTILLSNDGVNYTPFGGTQWAMKAPGIPDDPGQPRDNRCMSVFDLTGAVARYVKLDIIDNYGASEAVGLAELVFEGVTTGLGNNVPSDVITVAAPSTISGYNPQNIVNGSGFIAHGWGAHDWTDQSAGSGNNGWMGNFSGGQVSLTFTFDAPKNLTAVRIWNLSSWFIQGTAAVCDFELLTSTDGVMFESKLTDQLNPNAQSVIHDYSQSFTLSADNVLAVKMVITSAHNPASAYTGLNEIQFIQATDPVIPLTLQNTVSDEHGHWYDENEQSYRVYDRWLFDSDDVSIDLHAYNRVNFFIRPPAGYLLRIDESCSVSATVSLYDAEWTDEPFASWSLIDGTSQLQGAAVPAADDISYLTKMDGTRQFMLSVLSGESAGPWLFRSQILNVDVSSLTDPEATYSFGNDINRFLRNSLTFSSLTDSPVDTGMFTVLLPDRDYDLSGFSKLAAAWLSDAGDLDFTKTWDLIDDDTIDLADLAVFCENWLLNQK